jgi:hypothetical protein
MDAKQITDVVKPFMNHTEASVLDLPLIAEMIANAAFKLSLST